MDIVLYEVMARMKDRLLEEKGSEARAEDTGGRRWNSGRVAVRGLAAGILIVMIGTGCVTAVWGEEARYVPGQILVKFRPGTAPQTKERLAARMKTSVRRESSLTATQLLSLPSGMPVDEAVREYRQHPDVLYAEPNYIRRSSATIPNDPSFGQQWGLRNTGQTINATPPFMGRSGADIDAPAAWDITTGSPTIVIAVLDSGVDNTHPDLSANLTSGVNFTPEFSCNQNCDCTQIDPPVPPNNNPMDDSGHGTHVAGIIAARGNNGIGVTGVLWNAMIMPLKMLDQNGCGTVEAESEAIEYAIANGAQIINASFGSSGFSAAEKDEIRAAGKAGIVFVAAAGNESSDNDQSPVYPASVGLPNVISVAASDASDNLASVSNFGKNRVDIAAPGDCIYSTTPLGFFAMRNQISCANTPIRANYAFLTGTSMATPHVSGAVGLLLSADPLLSPDEIRAIVVSTAVPVDGLKGRVASSGRLNVYAALQRIKGTGSIGGSGGCGSPIGMLRSSDNPPIPPVQAGLFLAALFWPVLIPILRKRIGKRPGRKGRVSLRRGPAASAAGLLCLIVLKSATAIAEGEDSPFQPVHSLAAKFGYHRYNESDYLDTNSGLVSRNDLAGPAVEMEYDWRWRKDASLSVTAGRYESEADFKNVCCNSLRMTTDYLLLTPKHYGRFRSLEWYMGGGIGYYSFTRDIQGLINDHFSANTIGFHAVAGLAWPVLRRFSVFTEARYALAKVKDADSFGDSLDIGGLFYFIGASWRFSGIGTPDSFAD
jgi:subtilisin family serine protease/opacity protein-like surface antigen